MPFFFQGGVLASIEDPAEQAFIQSSVNVFLGSHSSFWIGLYKTHKGDKHTLLFDDKKHCELGIKNTPTAAYCCVMWETTDVTIMGLFALGIWQWLDKTVLSYTNWGEDEPEADYAEIASFDGTWSSGKRWHDRAYICKTPKGRCFPLNHFTIKSFKMR